MALTPELSELACRHGKCAELARAGVVRELERSVYGSDYGSTSGTTRAQAQQIAMLLELRPGTQLLDLGAGTGWPALYLAQLTGCDTVLVDLPLASLRVARERATADGLGSRCATIVADGIALPFGDAVFAAISHSDLLCCTPDKLGVLRSCRRVARDEARMAFTVILLAPALSEAERRIAIAPSPKFIESDEDYAVLLDRSGWRVDKRDDLTPAFGQSMRAELDGMHARSAALAEVYGADDFAARLKRQTESVASIDAGFVRRELFVARAAAR